MGSNPTPAYQHRFSNFPKAQRGFYLIVAGKQVVLNGFCGCTIVVLKPKHRAPAHPLQIPMRAVLKTTFLFLIWPTLAMAQDPPPVDPPPSPAAQTSSTTNDAASPDSRPSPSPPPITPMSLAPASLYLRTIRQPPIAPGYAPTFNVSAGYSVTNLRLPYSGSVTLSGVNTTFSADSGNIFGAVVEVGYARSANVAGSGHSMNALTYLAGPVFHVTRGRLLSTSAEVLFGGARIVGPVRNAAGGVDAGHVHYPAWAAGGGVEYQLSPAFGLRVNVDYLRTHFYNSSGAIRGQNDFRVVNSLVYYLKGGVRRRHQPEL